MFDMLQVVFRCPKNPFVCPIGIWDETPRSISYSFRFSLEPYSYSTILGMGLDSYAVDILQIVDMVNLQLFKGRLHTPLKTNMFSENQWLEDVFLTEIISFLGVFISFQGCKSTNQ